jgi:hypothetical protein
MLEVANQTTDNLRIFLLVLQEVINLSTASLVIGFHSPIRNNPLHNVAFVSLQFFTEALFWLTFRRNSTSILAFVSFLRPSFSVTFVPHPISSLFLSNSFTTGSLFPFSELLRLDNGCGIAWFPENPVKCCNLSYSSPFRLSLNGVICATLFHSSFLNFSCLQSSITGLLPFVTQCNLFIRSFMHAAHKRESKAIILWHFSMSTITQWLSRGYFSKFPAAFFYLRTLA